VCKYGYSWVLNLFEIWRTRVAVIMAGLIWVEAGVAGAVIMSIRDTL